MEIRFHRDRDTGLPHIYSHGIREHEVEEVLSRRGEDLPGTAQSRIKLGQTANGRYLKVVYVPDEFSGSVFVITAYDLGDKAKRAFRRRQRRKLL